MRNYFSKSNRLKLTQNCSELTNASMDALSIIYGVGDVRSCGYHKNLMFGMAWYAMVLTVEANFLRSSK